MPRTNAKKTVAQTTITETPVVPTTVTKTKTKKTKKSATPVVPTVVVPTHKTGGAFSSKRPGVLATIKASVMSCTGVADGLTKEQILDRLCAAFPERQRDHMKATVSMWVPSGARNEHKIVIQSEKRADGDKQVTVYWYDDKATREYQKTLAAK